jgi:membrane protein DedA with SNARE-associated domain
MRGLMEVILIKYGLIAVFIAASLEADVIPVLAGVAAHRGYFNPVFAVVAAGAGAFAGDCVWFYVGRHDLIRKNKLLQRIRPRAEALFQRVGHWQVPASHVIYGTRIATMTFVGTRGTSFAKFSAIDATSCLVLTTILFSLGYALSASVSVILTDVKRVEFVLLFVVAVVGLILHLLQRLGRRALQRTATSEHTS